MQSAKGLFEFNRWEESSYSENHGAPKLTQARVSNDFMGDITGSSDLVYVMTYLTADTGTFVGYEQVTGRLADRDGSFVVRADGTVDDGTGRAAVYVGRGSGARPLAGPRRA